MSSSLFWYVKLVSGLSEYRISSPPEGRGPVPHLPTQEGWGLVPHLPTQEGQGLVSHLPTGEGRGPVFFLIFFTFQDILC